MTATKGLEGVIATQSSISSIIDDQLTYVGYRIDDLAKNSSFEEVIYLLWNLKLPTESQLNEMKKELAENMDVPQGVIDHLRSYDLSTVHPMAALRSAVSILGLYDEEADIIDKEANMRKAIRLQAKMSAVVAAFARIRQGQDPVEPKADLSFAENFLYMLNGKEAEDIDRKSTRLNSSHVAISYAVFCLKKKISRI